MVAVALLAPGCDRSEPDPDVAPRDVATSSSATHLRFDDATARSGVAFAHDAGYTDAKHLPETMSGGVAITDLDRDGDPDLVLVNGGRLVGDARPPGSRNRVYLNDGAGHFTDVTVAWGLPSRGYGSGIGVGDIDADGFPDLYLTHYRGTDDLLLRNTGTRFEDVTRAAGLGTSDDWGTSAGFLDLDGDGALDLYVASYVVYDAATARPCKSAVGLHHYCAPIGFPGTLDRLYRNRGDGTFEDVSATSGIHGYAGRGLGLILGDLDDDGDADVYVANDMDRNHLFRNDGSGHFTDDGLLAGVALSQMGKAQAGMGVDLGDIDDDGRMDIVCTNFQGETNDLYRQVEGGFFLEVSDPSGLGASARAHLGFGVDFFDADNDGDEDLLVVNGHVDDNIAAQTPSVSFAQRNLLYEATGDGAFVNVTDGAGSALADVQVSRGLATSDLDGDGDLDYVVVNNGGTAQVAFNESSQMGGFVSLWLEGRAANRSAIGTRVIARVGDRVLRRQVLGSSSYQSVNDPRVHLGLGDATGVDSLTVIWPGGEEAEFTALEGGRFYHLVQGEAPEAYVPGAGPR